MSARLCGHPLRRERLDNLLSVKPPVLNENLSRVPPANHHARQVNSRNVALQRVRIERRLAGNRIEMHSQVLDELEIRMISSEGEYLFCGQPLFAAAVGDNHFVRRNL